MVYRVSDEESFEGSRRRYRAPRRWVGWLVALVIILAIAGGIYYAYRYVMDDVTGAKGSANPLIIEIPDGANADVISELLERNGIVENKFLFRNYLRFFVTDTPDFMNGPHEFRANMSYDEIIPVLETPMLDLRETITLQFIDGWTTLRMGMYLEEEGICSIDEWLEACDGVYDVPFYNEISDNENKFTKLEGFLFPDKYEFYEDVTPEEIVQKMLETFDEKILQDPVIAPLIPVNDLSLEEIVILASVIEKETGEVNEIYKVSSVFHNRLAEDSPLESLQSCATQKYTVGVLDYYFIDLKGGETPEDMEFYYDTYMCEGLMAGAICNPGRLSIEATLTPAETPYYYFLMDDTGMTYYSEDYYGHQQNIAQMRAANAEVAAGAGLMD